MPETGYYTPGNNDAPADAGQDLHIPTAPDIGSFDGPPPPPSHDLSGEVPLETAPLAMPNMDNEDPYADQSGHHSSMLVVLEDDDDDDRRLRKQTGFRRCQARCIPSISPREAPCPTGAVNIVPIPRARLYDDRLSDLVTGFPHSPRRDEKAKSGDESKIPRPLQHQAPATTLLKKRT